MVLASMMAKEWREKARKDGREQGRREGRERRRKRLYEAFDRFGVDVNGVIMLPKTPEVERFLAGESEQ